MAYTLLDAAYEMYYPEAEFAALGGKKSSLGRRLRSMAGKAGGAAARVGGKAGRLARRAGGFAMRNKGKVALGAGGALALGAGGLYAGSVVKRAMSSKKYSDRNQVSSARKAYRNAERSMR